MSMRMNRTWIVSIALAVPIALGWIYAAGLYFGIGIAGREGWTIGYYGKFNRVRNVTEHMPDVQIIDTWQHRDVTLEDFGFTIRSDSGRTAEVNFMENSPQMKMNAPKDIEAYVRASLPKQP